MQKNKVSKVCLSNSFLLKVYMELYSMLCGSMDGRGLWGKMVTCVCMAESHCCSPETITTLLIGYTPIQIILSPCLFNLYAEYIMRNAGLEETQAGIKNARRNINNLRYADDTTLMAESEEELKSLSMKVKEESEKIGLKLNIQKTKIMASGPITSWEVDGETMETVSDFNFLGSKIMVTAAMKLKDAYSLEGKF